MEEGDTSEHGIKTQEFSSADSLYSKIPSWERETRMATKDRAEHEIGMEDYVKHQDDDIPSANERLKIRIEGRIREVPQRSSDCSIFRVPKRLLYFNIAACTPEIVSIGPFHRSNPDLQAMEEQKMRYVQTFRERFDSGFIERCIREIGEHEERIRNHYDEIIEMSSCDFVEMILLDAIFIIGFMLIIDEAHANAPNNLLVMQKDMILLENQIPFFILVLLFNLACPDHQRSFIQLSIRFFRHLFLASISEYPNMETPNLQADKVKHFVDMLRLCHLPSPLGKKYNEAPTRFGVSKATKLREVGMKFKKRSGKRLLDIHYDDKMKTLEIPPFVVSFHTEHVLKNMVALEQFCYGMDTYITDYVIFMDNLIDTAKDVDLLIEDNIIQSFRGDSFEVSRIFNHFTDQVPFSPNFYYYNDITQHLNKYCEDSWNTLRATLKRDYCRTPWMMASTIAAIVLLLLTFIQTILSIVSIST